MPTLLRITAQEDSLIDRLCLQNKQNSWEKDTEQSYIVQTPRPSNKQCI